MDIFSSLMQIYLILVGVNLVVVFLLWRSTQFRPFLSLTLHWCFLLLGFFIQRSLAPEEPYLRIVSVAFPNFAIHYCLVLTFTQMLGISFPLKKLIWTPVVVIFSTLILHFLGATPFVIALPLVLAHASMYFYVVYQAFKRHRDQLSFSLKAVAVLFVLYGLHLLDYAYFYTRLELLAVGFTIAVIFLLAFSVLFPTSILEQISRENARLEAEVKYRAQLTQAAKMAALGEMAGGVAHEMNTPLTVLSLLLEQMDEQVQTSSKDPELDVLIRKGQNTVQRMAKIIKSLLMFSKEDHKTQFLKVSLSDLVQDTLVLCSERMKKHQVQLKVELPREETILTVQPTQISQVLLNLLNNAFDAVENEAEKWIRLSALNLADRIEISVENSGPKLSSELREKIFQPFFSTKEIGKGTGLGLSISKGIIELHHGELFLDSQSLHTRFVFKIPKSFA